MMHLPPIIFLQKERLAFCNQYPHEAIVVQFQSRYHLHEGQKRAWARMRVNYQLFNRRVR